MDIDTVIRRVINDHDPGLTTGAANLGTLIADALADAEIAQLGDEQVADYIRALGDNWAERHGHDLPDRLAEAIEEDLDDEEEN